ncbi:MAG: hypothetical protein ACR2GH_09270 [Pseudonocardia sp.]
MDDTDVQATLDLIHDAFNPSTAFAAVGVLAARDADPNHPGPMLPAGTVDRRATLPTVRWSDPRLWLRRAGNDAGLVAEDWWRAEVGLDPRLGAGVRIVVDAATVGVEVPVAALSVPQSVAEVRSAVAEAAFQPGGRRSPGWTWPLRLSIDEGWSAEPGWVDGGRLAPRRGPPDPATGRHDGVHGNRRPGAGAHHSRATSTRMTTSSTTYQRTFTHRTRCARRHRAGLV